MDNSPSATRQPKQARAIRTRERILDQAEHAFAAKGFETASLTSDILEPAGISVGSFYHQFSDKRAVLHALVEERHPWHELAATIDAPDGQASFEDAVRRSLEQMLDDIDERPAPWAIHFRELCNSDPDVRELIVASWSVWEEAVASMFARWHESAAAGRSVYATAGLSGVLRRYLDGDESARRVVRQQLLDDVVAACVASLS